MADAITIMKWEKIVPWKILSLKLYPEENPRPVGYGFNSPKIKEKLGPGSVIWVITMIGREYSLAGKVVIEQIIDRNDHEYNQFKTITDLFTYRYVAVSKFENSQFFEANNAKSNLLEITGRNQIFSQSLTIDYSDYQLEDKFRSCIKQASKQLFITYRWEGARIFAFKLAREFRHSNLSPWLDKYALKEFIEKDDPVKSKQRLIKLLEFGIENSKFAVIINTKNYQESEWTSFEVNHVIEKNIPCYQVMRGGKLFDYNISPVYGSNSKAVAKEIIKQWNLNGCIIFPNKRS